MTDNSPSPCAPTIIFDYRTAAFPLILSAARQRATAVSALRPFIIAVDGHSGVGKSTFARRLARDLDGAVIEGDDFYDGGLDVGLDPPESRAARCIDWRSQRDVLETLRHGREACWFPFDWSRFDGSLSNSATIMAPCRFIVFEGVYSARSELADLIDYAVLLRLHKEHRTARLTMREGQAGPWDHQWREAEDWYLSEGLAGRQFDMIVDQ